MKIGIPQALICWKRPFFWENFFEALGFEVLASPKTNKEIVEQGVKVSDPENCFSNKVYWGHLLWLDGKCDLVFIPRLKTNEEKLEYCPKFFCLPDLAKILIKTPILTQTFDLRKESLSRTFGKLGKKLKKNNRDIKKALKVALSKEKKLKEKEKRDFFEKINSKKKKIILISHPYNLYDEYVNLRMKERFEKLGVMPIFIDEVFLGESETVNKNLKFKEKGKENLERKLSFPDFHWEFGKEIMEKIREVLNYKISGAVEISAFACGCDAVLKEFVVGEFKNKKIPFLYLIIDEHTGEAGFQTRLEAFLDTLDAS